MGRVTDQDAPAEERVRLINFHDRNAACLPRLIKQRDDRGTEVVEVTAPIARRTTVSRGNVGVAVNGSFTQRDCDHAASRCQSSVPGIVVAVPALRNEAPAPAATLPGFGAAHTRG